MSYLSAAATDVSPAAIAAILGIASSQVRVSIGGGSLSITYLSGAPSTLVEQQAVDAYVASCGYAATYPLTLTAPQPTETPSTVTATAAVGDSTYAGAVSWYTWSTPTLQGTTAATAGVATLPVTGNASGPLVLTAWVPPYTTAGGQQAGGYASVTLQFP